jgi:hypothetical protein
MIFNWEVKPGERKVFRPDDPAKGDSGSEAVSKPAPLALNVWYTLRWRISGKSTDAFVNGQLVFTGAEKYDLSARKQVRVQAAADSVIEVKSFTVRPLWWRLGH